MLATKVSGESPELRATWTERMNASKEDVEGKEVKVVEVVANVDEGKWVDNEVEGGEEEKRDGA